MKTYSDFEKYKNMLQLYKKNFTITKKGNVITVEVESEDENISSVFRDDRYDFYDEQELINDTQVKSVCHDLLKRFKQKVSIRNKKGVIDNAIDNPELYQVRTKTDYIDKNAIDYMALDKTKDYSIQCNHFDICNCHWDTSFNLGIIDQSMYRYGHQSEDWKLYRNMCIGRLNEQYTVETYFLGESIKREVLSPETQKYYYAIINRVHNFFVDISKEFPNKFICGSDDSFFMKELNTLERTKILHFALNTYGYGLSIRSLNVSVKKDNNKVFYEGLASDENKYFRKYLDL